jgi:hypothetical protein
MPSAEMMLLIGRAVFLVFSFVLAASAFTAWRRATRKQTEQILAQSEAVLQRLGALEARLESAAAALTRIDERVEQGGMRSGSPGYQVAIRMARGGASREELMSSCGLSLSEADIVRRLHSAVSSVAA